MTCLGGVIGFVSVSVGPELRRMMGKPALSGGNNPSLVIFLLDLLMSVLGCALLSFFTALVCVISGFKFKLILKVCGTQNLVTLGALTLLTARSYL